MANHNVLDLNAVRDAVDLAEVVETVLAKRGIDPMKHTSRYNRLFRAAVDIYCAKVQVDAIDRGNPC